MKMRRMLLSQTIYPSRDPNFQYDPAPAQWYFKDCIIMHYKYAVKLFFPIIPGVLSDKLNQDPLENNVEV